MCWICQALSMGRNRSDFLTKLLRARWNRAPLPRQTFNYLPIYTLIWMK
jgi:hypothetical protein